MFETDLIYLLLLPIGVIAGYLNVMAGGGSLLTVPTMIFLGMPGEVANGTNRIAILAQNVSAVSSFHSRGYSDFRLGLTLTACTIPGAIAGAFAGTIIRGNSFNWLLAGVMIATMLLMARDKSKAKPAFNLSPRQRQAWGHWLMVAVGFYGGLIQIGVGLIIMPILYRVMHIDLVRVNMYKVLIVLGFTIVSLVVYAGRLDLVWLAGLFLAIGNAVGGWIGAHISVTRGEKTIRLLLNMVLVLMIVKLLFFS